jgi:hypothetical protein
MSYKLGTTLIRRKITCGGDIIPIGGVVKVLMRLTTEGTGYEVEIVRNCKLPSGISVFSHLYDDFVPLHLILKRKTL